MKINDFLGNPIVELLELKHKALFGITQKRANEKFSKDHDHTEAMKNMKPHTQTYQAGPNGEAIKIIEPIQILPTHTHNMPPLSNEMLAEKINEIINHINK